MILVTGATGLTGGALVRRLSATGIPVRALVRSAARADRLSALPAVEIVEGDMAHPLVQTILGRPATSFDEFAVRHAAIFRGEQPEPKV